MAQKIAPHTGPGTDIEAFSDTALPYPGQLGGVTEIGFKVYQAVKFVDATVSQGDVVYWKDSATFEVTPTISNSSAAEVAGVATAAQDANDYGYILVSGKYNTKATGTLARGDSVYADSSNNRIVELQDNSTGTASNTIAAGVGSYNLTFQFDLADIADGDLVSDLLLNHKFKIIESYFVATEPVTTASKATTISLDIDDVAVTNSAIALTSANCTPAGAKVQNAGALAANTGSATATLTIKAASTTAFVEGKGVLVICIQNMDTADAVASLAARPRPVGVALGSVSSGKANVLWTLGPKTLAG